MNWLISAIIDRATNDQFLDKILIGIAGAATLKAAALLYGKVSEAIFARRNFTLTGLWFARFESYVGNKHNIEVVRFVQQKERVKFHLQQYSTSNSTLRKFAGLGIVRGPALSAVYYSTNRQTLQSGVFSLSVAQNTKGDTLLKGHYAELHIGKNKGIAVSKEEYVLTPLNNLPVVARIKLMCKLQCFQNYLEAKKTIDAALT